MIVQRSKTKYASLDFEKTKQTSTGTGTGTQTFSTLDDVRVSGMGRAFAFSQFLISSEHLLIDTWTLLHFNYFTILFLKQFVDQGVGDFDLGEDEFVREPDANKAKFGAVATKET